MGCRTKTTAILKNITNKTFKEAGEAVNMKEDKAKKHTKELLETLEAVKGTA